MPPPAIALPRWRRTSATASACGASCGSLPSRETRELAAGLRYDAPGEPPESLSAAERGGGVRTALVALPWPLPLVGRSGELASLVGEWAAARAGSGGVVVLDGEAGIGKSRLTAESAVHALRDGARVALGAGIELEAAAPLAPWAELLDTLVEIPEDVRWGADLARLVPRLGLRDPAGRGPPEELARVRLYEAVVSAVADAATAAPLLLVLEDAHLADGASLALLAHLGRRLHNLASLLVVTRRPIATEALDAVEEHLARAGVLARPSCSRRCTTTTRARSSGRRTPTSTPTRSAGR